MQPTPAISLAKRVVPSRLTIEPVAYSGQSAHGTGSGASAGCVVGGVDPPPPPTPPPPPPRAKAGLAVKARVAAVMAAAMAFRVPDMDAGSGPRGRDGNQTLVPG